MGRPFRGINLHALEKRSTSTHVWPSEFGRSVMKSTPMCDQGLWGTGRGTSLPAGRWRGVFDMAQTEQLRTYLMTSSAILGHQYRAWRSERVRWLPGCPEPGTSWTESRMVKRWEDGMYVLPSGPPCGAGSVRVVSQMRLVSSHWIGLTMRAGGRIGSGSEGWSGACRRESASALGFWFPGR